MVKIKDICCKYCIQAQSLKFSAGNCRKACDQFISDVREMFVNGKKAKDINAIDALMYQVVLFLSDRILQCTECPI